jgi:hypothetical protein
MLLYVYHDAAAFASRNTKKVAIGRLGSRVATFKE